MFRNGRCIINVVENDFCISEDKRNIQSFKSGQVPAAKVKRDTLYDSNAEILEPVYQAAPMDYDKYNEIMSELYPYSDTEIHDDKRFLGK